MYRVLLGADMDRTLLPNGSQPESPQARRLLHSLRAHPQVLLAYLTGRSRELIQAALAEFDLPLPDFAAADVGTTLYRVHDGVWEEWEDWAREIAGDWGAATGRELSELFPDVPGLELQEPDRQKRFKLSYYAPPDWDRPRWLPEMDRRLRARDVRAQLVWSLDEPVHRGLLDVIPERATKDHAARWLLQRLGVPPERAVVAGDSGNDLPMLVGELQAVLVANARPEVRAEAEHLARQAGHPDRLYVARGDFLGMNGNYAAGVLEGLAHYLPETRGWLEAALEVG